MTCRDGCCLAEGSLVATQDGPTPIENVTAGDMVFAYNSGRLVRRHVVSNTNQGESDVFAVKCSNRTVVATDNHQFLVARFPTGHNRGQTLPDLEWRRLDDLTKDDYIVITAAVPIGERDTVSLPDNTLLTEDIAWLMGSFLANGFISHHNDVPVSVTWKSYHESIRDRIGKIVTSTWGLMDSESDFDSLKTFMDRDLAAMWDTLFGGPARFVPQTILNADPTLWSAFLDGFAAGSQHIDGFDYQVAHIGNESLIRQLHGIRWMLGHRVDNVRPLKTPDNVLPDDALWTFQTSPGREQGNTSRLRRNGHMFRDPYLTVERIKSIRPAGTAVTYDLTIVDNHNFVADGIVVHN
jgi:hypothetical protein